MDISVIIVSYNNSTVLMLALAAVRRAIEELNAEVFVVDNNSHDGTPERVKAETPWVRLIEMDRNAGFSTANNEALKICSGRTVLILNPDTVVSKNSLREMVDYFDKNPKSGAMGVRMVNGKGRYLGESKRGRTTLRTSFFKITGLWHLAPKSAVINGYYLGNESETGTCKAPILSGACMAFSHALLEKVGYFDENYFMYCEDNDLSWRMNITSEEGNVYRGDINIIHFKGQSTPRNSKYVGYFYDSMRRYANIYELEGKSKLTKWFVNLGINVAYYVALVRGSILSDIENNSVFKRPQSLTYVSDNEQNIAALRSQMEGQNTKVTTMSYNDLEIRQQTKFGTEATLFDIDGDMNRAIEYMRANEKRTLFGFYNPDGGDALIFFNNRCHKI